MKFTIIIPFNNEFRNLIELLPELEKSLKKINIKHEVIFINDGSTDNGLMFCKEFCSDKNNWQIISLDNQSGQARSFAIAFKLAKGEYIIRMDADLQDSPSDLPLFIKKIEDGSELVMGLRECRKHRRVLRFASMVYDMIILILYDTPLHSNSGSYIAFHAELVKNISLQKNDHRYLPLIAIRRGAENISEVIVTHRKRKYGHTKYPTFRKIAMGIPELIFFLIRLQAGYYDKK